MSDRASVGSACGICERKILPGDPIITLPSPDPSDATPRLVCELCVKRIFDEEFPAAQ